MPKATGEKSSIESSTSIDPAAEPYSAGEKESAIDASREKKICPCASSASELSDWRLYGERKEYLAQDGVGAAEWSVLGSAQERSAICHGWV